MGRLKTSLGIWAFGSMVTRFMPVGYQPAAHEQDDRREGAPRRLGPRRPDRRLRVPLPGRALAGQPRRGALGARRARHLHALRGPAPRSALRPRRPRQPGSRDPGGGAAPHARGRRLRRLAGRALRAVARHRGLQLPVPDALCRQLGLVHRGRRPGRRGVRQARPQAVPGAQEQRARDEDPDAQHRHDAARHPQAARPGDRRTSRSTWTGST